MFHARGPAAAKDRSPSDDIVRGTANELDAADLRPGLTVAAADCMICYRISNAYIIAQWNEYTAQHMSARIHYQKISP